jgi:hypothetical protein
MLGVISKDKGKCKIAPVTNYNIKTYKWREGSISRCTHSGPHYKMEVISFLHNLTLSLRKESMIATVGETVWVPRAQLDIAKIKISVPTRNLTLVNQPMNSHFTN